jgi:hypothetical protein
LVLPDPYLAPPFFPFPHRKDLLLNDNQKKIPRSDLGKKNSHQQEAASLSHSLRTRKTFEVIRDPKSTNSHAPPSKHTRADQSPSELIKAR